MTLIASTATIWMMKAGFTKPSSLLDYLKRQLRQVGNQPPCRHV